MTLCYQNHVTPLVQYQSFSVRECAISRVGKSDYRTIPIQALPRVHYLAI